MEEKITFSSESYKIEGLLNKGIGKEKGVVITHPHPLYGGDMYNYVVETIAHAYWQKGYSTLRFNFRGVGKSQGSYDNGIGEQKDLLAVLSYFTETGIKEIDLAGYSFGAWINSRINCKDMPIQKMVMVSPPVGFIDFQPILPIPSLELVITGSDDEFAPLRLVQKILPLWNSEARLEVISGADHFYGGFLQALESSLFA